MKLNQIQAPTKYEPINLDNGFTILLESRPHKINELPTEFNAQVWHHGYNQKEFVCITIEELETFLTHIENMTDCNEIFNLNSNPVTINC